MANPRIYGPFVDYSINHTLRNQSITHQQSHTSINLTITYESNHQIINLLHDTTHIPAVLLYCSWMVVIKLPYLKSSMLCSKLSKGIGHNNYGEPAWPNDILYIFPIVISGISSSILGLAIHSALGIIENATPFATPLEILPEWYLLPTFNLLRILSDKCIGILSMFYFPGVLINQQPNK